MSLEDDVRRLLKEAADEGDRLVASGQPLESAMGFHTGRSESILILLAQRIDALEAQIAMR